MGINFKNYQIIKKCHGNGVNKIYIVMDKSSNEFFIIKIIELEDEDR